MLFPGINNQFLKNKNLRVGKLIPQQTFRFEYQPACVFILLKTFTVCYRPFSICLIHKVVGMKFLESINFSPFSDQCCSTIFKTMESVASWILTEFALSTFSCDGNVDCFSWNTRGHLLWLLNNTLNHKW